MDQVLTILERNAIPFDSGGESATTSTMINNYVKHGILPPPYKKKYQRDHLAVLTIIALCKRVLSLAEIDSFVLLMTENHELAKVYDLFCTELERALFRTFSKSESEKGVSPACGAPFSGSDVDPSAPTGIALLALVQAVAHKLRLLSVLPQKDSDKDEGQKSTKTNT